MTIESNLNKDCSLLVYITWSNSFTIWTNGLSYNKSNSTLEFPCNDNKYKFYIRKTIHNSYTMFIDFKMFNWYCITVENSLCYNTTIMEQSMLEVCTAWVFWGEWVNEFIKVNHIYINHNNQETNEIYHLTIIGLDLHICLVPGYNNC